MLIVFIKCWVHVINAETFHIIKIVNNFYFIIKNNFSITNLKLYHYVNWLSICYQNDKTCVCVCNVKYKQTPLACDNCCQFMVSKTLDVRFIPSQQAIKRFLPNSLKVLTASLAVSQKAPICYHISTPNSNFLWIFSSLDDDIIGFQMNFVVKDYSVTKKCHFFLVLNECPSIKIAMFIILHGWIVYCWIVVNNKKLNLLDTLYIHMLQGFTNRC